MTREELLIHLKRTVLKTTRVIEAFEKVDRADFVRPGYLDEAYEDHPLPIGGGGTISQPYTVAFMLELLQPEPAAPTKVGASLARLAERERGWAPKGRGDKILDIGSGSGWSTTLLVYILSQKGNSKSEARNPKEGGKVIGLEIVSELVKFGQKNLAKYNFPNAEIRQAESGVVGLPNESPFDRILVSAAASKIPEELIDQLASPGRLVIPVQNSLWLVEKEPTGKITKTEYPGFVFVPFK